MSMRGLVGQVVRNVGADIVSGRLKPGQPLPREADWAEELGVSRTVLREATKVLISKGLVESRPRLGTKVRDAQALELARPRRSALAARGGAARSRRARALRAETHLRAGDRGARCGKGVGEGYSGARRRLRGDGAHGRRPAGLHHAGRNVPQDDRAFGREPHGRCARQRHRCGADDEPAPFA